MQIRGLWRTALAGLASIVLIAGAANYLTRRPIDITAVPEGPIAVASTAGMPDTGLKFTILPTATVSAPEGAMFEGGNWFKRRTMAHSAVLICHPEGFVLFDTGLGRAIDSQFKDFPLTTRMAFGYKKLTPAANVIADTHPCPNRPLIIIPSHLHWDHAGGVADLPDAEVWVSAEKLQQARNAGVKQGFLPGEIDSSAIKWKMISLDERPYEQYSRSLDVFGDGSLILVPMAGHTPGSVGLFISTGAHRYFFTGDTTWAYEGLTPPAHKFFAARSLADLDPGQLEKEIVGVHRLMQRDPKLIVIPAHDLAAYPPESVYPNWVGAEN